MTAQRANRVSAWGLVVLSLSALLTVLSAAVPIALGSQVPAALPDEAEAAGILRLSIVALVPLGLLFAATADWRHPAYNVRRLAFPAFAVIVALAILYCLERLN